MILLLLYWFVHCKHVFTRWEIYTCRTHKYNTTTKAFCCIHNYLSDECINPFHATGLFLDPVKTLENLSVSDVFRRCRKRPVVLNGLIPF